MISKAMAAWLLSDDTGISSKAIWAHMNGLEVEDFWPPADPSDFGRCARLLAQFPQWSERICEMSRYSPEWAALTARWGEIHYQMDQEVGIDWSKGKSAPKTYRLMKEITKE